MKIHSSLSCMLGVALAIGAGGTAYAQTWPAKPIKIVVAYPPGGPNDLSARTVGQRLSEALGQPVIVENRAGAAGNIGSQYVATSPPDGYALLNGASALTISPALSKNLQYQRREGFRADQHDGHRWTCSPRIRPCRQIRSGNSLPWQNRTRASSITRHRVWARRRISPASC